MKDWSHVVIVSWVELNTESSQKFENYLWVFVKLTLRIIVRKTYHVYIKKISLVYESVSWIVFVMVRYWNVTHALFFMSQRRMSSWARFLIFTKQNHLCVSQAVGVYNRNLADLPNEPGSVGVYNRNLADHPVNQMRLGYIIGAWLTSQRTRCGWGIQ